MKSLEEIRADLRFIREYYKLKRTMKRPFEVTDHGDYKSLIARYDTLAKAAPKRQAQVYEGLYLQGKTQKALAQEWEVTEKYIQILNKRRLLFLQSHWD